MKNEDWISVKDDLPKNDDYVLIFMAKFGKPGIGSKMIAYYDYWTVTHWQSLPNDPI